MVQPESNRAIKIPLLSKVATVILTIAVMGMMGSLIIRYSSLLLSLSYIAGPILVRVRVLSSALDRRVNSTTCYPMWVPSFGFEGFFPFFGWLRGRGVDIGCNSLGCPVAFLYTAEISSRNLKQVLWRTSRSPLLYDNSSSILKIPISTLQPLKVVSYYIDISSYKKKSVNSIFFKLVFSVLYTYGLCICTVSSTKSSRGGHLPEECMPWDERGDDHYLLFSPCYSSNPLEISLQQIQYFNIGFLVEYIFRGISSLPIPNIPVFLS